MKSQNEEIRDCEKAIAELKHNIMILEYDHAEQNAIHDLACNAVNDGKSGGMFDTIDFQIFKVILIFFGSVYLVFVLVNWFI